ncbi:hypothetical protein KJ885_02520 [Patescibacteria group bacterium]|nr:hypothetical protein [Patescibacteria group bacterium]
MVMKKVLSCFFVFVFLCFCVLGCSNGLGMTLQNVDNAKRAKMCKARCNKKHYNITIIRASGKVEKYKINVVSIDEKMACECVF